MYDGAPLAWNATFQQAAAPVQTQLQCGLEQQFNQVHLMPNAFSQMPFQQQPQVQQRLHAQHAQHRQCQLVHHDMQAHRTQAQERMSADEYGLGWLWDRDHLGANELAQCRASIVGLHALLATERRKAADLASSLDSSEKTVSELEVVLKEFYVRDFMEKQQHGSVPRNMPWKVGKRASPRREPRKISRGHRLAFAEPYGDRPFVTEALKDSVCLRSSEALRHFEAYNVPGVVTSLFRKVLELQARLRSNREARRNAARISSDAPRDALHGGPALSRQRNEFASARSPASAFADIDTEVRDHLCDRSTHTVSRHELEAYLEPLWLAHVSPAMAADVILMFLGLP